MIKIYSGCKSVTNETTKTATDYSYEPTDHFSSSMNEDLFGFRLTKHSRAYSMCKGAMIKGNPIVKTSMVVYLNTSEIQQLYDDPEEFWEVNIEGVKTVFDNKEGNSDTRILYLHKDIRVPDAFIRSNKTDYVDITNKPDIKLVPGQSYVCSTTIDVYLYNTSEEAIELCDCPAVIIQFTVNNNNRYYATTPSDRWVKQYKYYLDKKVPLKIRFRITNNIQHPKYGKYVDIISIEIDKSVEGSDERSNDNEMTDSEFQNKIDNLYPLCVISDRYGGCYSGGNYTAWTTGIDFIPDGIFSDDVECSLTWDELKAERNEHKIAFGVGNTPDEALRDLIYWNEKLTQGE